MDKRNSNTSTSRSNIYPVWDSGFDLEILMQAEQIRKDSKRLAAAKAFAVKRYQKMKDADQRVSSELEDSSSKLVA